MVYQRILKDGINVFSGKLSSTIFGLLIFIILTRILSVEEMGKYTLIFMVVSFALSIGLNWSDNSLARFGREEYVKTKKVNHTYWARMIFYLPIMILFIAVFLLFRDTLTSYIGIDNSFIILLISIFILQSLMNTLIYIFQAIDLLRNSALVTLLQKLVYLLCLSFIYFGFLDASISLIIIFLNLSLLITVAFFLFRFDLSVISPIHFDKNQAIRIWNFSWPQFIGFSGLFTIQYIDTFVIKHYLTIEDVGIYSISYKGFEVLVGLLAIANMIFLPLITEFRTKKQKKIIYRLFKKIPLAAAVWFGISILIILSSKFIIPAVFSSKYAASIHPFNILVFGTFLTFVNILLEPLFNSFDKTLYLQLTNIAMALCNVFLDFLFVPVYGISGAATATLFSFGFCLTLRIAIILKLKNTLFN